MALILDPYNQATPAGSAPGDLIKDTNTENFARDVMDASMQVPVIVDFWAPWCGPCKQLGSLLEKLVRAANGRVRLVKVNVDENQSLAAQLRVQSIPMVYAFVGGRPVDAFVGAQPESKLRSFVDRLTADAKAPLDALLAEAQTALDQGQAREATAMFSQILAEDPGNAKAVAGLLRSFVLSGNVSHARKMAEEIGPDLRRQPDVVAALTAIDVADETGTKGDVRRLESAVSADPADMQARYDLALALFGAGQAEAAADQLLEIVRRDRTWNEEAARQQLIKFFDALGGTHPVTISGRRRLSSLLFS
ncbi:MAG: co-chaperone YbbN [Rhodospirillales bacterium]|nr:MAG: co-chaperone YbbN [Rhodospirillales bacterium]